MASDESSTAIQVLLMVRNSRPCRQSPAGIRCLLAVGPAKGASILGGVYAAGSARTSEYPRCPACSSGGTIGFPVQSAVASAVANPGVGRQVPPVSQLLSTGTDSSPGTCGLAAAMRCTCHGGSACRWICVPTAPGAVFGRGRDGQRLRGRWVRRGTGGRIGYLVRVRRGSGGCLRVCRGGRSGRQCSRRLGRGDGALGAWWALLPVRQRSGGRVGLGRVGGGAVRHNVMAISHCGRRRSPGKRVCVGDRQAARLEPGALPCCACISVPGAKCDARRLITIG
jgi:hypothetical protein